MSCLFCKLLKPGVVSDFRVYQWTYRLQVTERSRWSFYGTLTYLTPLPDQNKVELSESITGQDFIRAFWETDPDEVKLGKAHWHNCHFGILGISFKTFTWKICTGLKNLSLRQSLFFYRVRILNDDIRLFLIPVLNSTLQLLKNLRLRIFDFFTGTYSECIICIGLKGYLVLMLLLA